MNEDHLTRVDPDAEDRVRLVAQRPTPAVEEIGLHRSTLPFRSPTRPRGPSRNRGRRAAGDESGLRASGGHPPCWRTGGSVPVVAVDDLSTEGLPSADVRSWLRGRAHPWPGPRQRPRGMGGRCRTWCCRTWCCRTWCCGPRGTRPPANYLLSSVVSFSTRRSMSSSTVPVLGRPRLPASSDSSLLGRLS